MNDPVEPCPTCPEGWRQLGKAHCAGCYEGTIESLRATYNDLLALQGQADQVPLTTALDAVGSALAALSR